MTVAIRQGDCREVLKTLRAKSVHCCVTSPPYFGLRDYGEDDQIGLESSADNYVAQLVDVFREVRRVLRDDGTVWLNLGDSYGGTSDGNTRITTKDKKEEAAKKVFGKARGLKKGGRHKDLMGIPWRVAFALQNDGWYLRQDIIWSKPNPMPESITDRCTKAHEYIFLLSKSAQYYYDADSIAEPVIIEHRKTIVIGRGLNGHAKARGDDRSCSGGFPNEKTTRNKRSVWVVNTRSYDSGSDEHFATFPPALIKPCILAGCPKGGTVLDPFGGAGTTGLVSTYLKRKAILIELNPKYAAMAARRIRGHWKPTVEEAAELAAMNNDAIKSKKPKLSGLWE